MPVASTVWLRQRVLRPHQSVEELHRAGDDHPDVAGYAAVGDDDAIIATATIRPEPCPWQPEREPAWRLRGMATEPTHRGHGLGTAVLNAALAHVAMAGGGLVWCNARTPALDFYLRAGFRPHGEEWVDPDIGPHRALWREVILPLD